MAAPAETARPCPLGANHWAHAATFLRLHELLGSLLPASSAVRAAVDRPGVYHRMLPAPLREGVELGEAKARFVELEAMRGPRRARVARCDPSWYDDRGWGRLGVAPDVALRELAEFDVHDVILPFEDASTGFFLVRGPNGMLRFECGGFGDEGEIPASATAFLRNAIFVYADWLSLHGYSSMFLRPDDTAVVALLGGALPPWSVVCFSMEDFSPVLKVDGTVVPLRVANARRGLDLEVDYGDHRAPAGSAAALREMLTVAASAALERVWGSPPPAFLRSNTLHLLPFRRTGPDLRDGVMRVVRQVHPDKCLGPWALELVQDLLATVWEAFMDAAAPSGGLALAGLPDALSRVVPGPELLKHASCEAAKSVTKFNTGQGGQHRSMGFRAGLSFEVESVAEACAARMPTEDAAAVFITAVLEYLSAELMELGGNATPPVADGSDDEARVALPSLLVAIRDDEELAATFGKRLAELGLPQTGP